MKYYNCLELHGIFTNNHETRIKYDDSLIIPESVENKRIYIVNEI